jgi:hypothetical protein
MAAFRNLLVVCGLALCTAGGAASSSIRESTKYNDPWYGAKWTSNADGTYRGTYSPPKNVDDHNVQSDKNVVGHVVVVHLNNGTKAACGVIYETKKGDHDHRMLGGGGTTSSSSKSSDGCTDSTHRMLGGGASSSSSSSSTECTVIHAHVSKLPAYSGDVEIEGNFTFNVDARRRLGGGGDSSSQIFRYDVTYSLSGLESDNTGAWHVHEGHSCDEPGGHLLLDEVIHEPTTNVALVKMGALLGAVVGMLFVFFIMRSKEHRAARSSRSGSVTAAVDQTKEGAII